MKYNLTTPEHNIATSWLFEVQGYLDQAVNISGISARAALAAQPILDVTDWIRTNSKHPNSAQSDWDECGMVWWIRSHSNVNITPAIKPLEAAVWIDILTGWGDSITSGLQRADIQTRNAGNTVSLTAEDGSVFSMPAGNQLQQQQTMIDKVKLVLS
ncbi:MAG: hypothetical protein L0287_01700 [Anaerolineae bacterium]|nr:hypothetical protein [Anaerolineae bacterium]